MRTLVGVLLVLAVAPASASASVIGSTCGAAPQRVIATRIAETGPTITAMLDGGL